MVCYHCATGPGLFAWQLLIWWSFIILWDKSGRVWLILTEVLLVIILYIVCVCVCVCLYVTLYMLDNVQYRKSISVLVSLTTSFTTGWMDGGVLHHSKHVTERRNRSYFTLACTFGCASWPIFASDSRLPTKNSSAIFLESVSSPSPAFHFQSQLYPITQVKVIGLLLLVFSPWAGLGRDQSSVRRLVWLWYAASWASS